MYVKPIDELDAVAWQQRGLEPEQEFEGPHSAWSLAAKLSPSSYAGNGGVERPEGQQNDDLEN